ncbi:uncharacterized protein BDZ99DRAFT_463021 [Mytilinidion resinicola]|uniref:MARVEL domain-containing protein n=1 Tax=Mytilinidion resinicola TaxID=574789 RepID=A0A6A6YNX0_9PEZI|nr:uncharacterized protein BDZ99DRAFT_463021 [Mytilinidion resinicola]KAF2810441.1 hypothetical protein BDZ99DRAFT_463021 [Mytilinidion resinicola]
MSSNKKNLTVSIIKQERSNSSDSDNRSLKTPRTARFAEATTVHSPVDGRGPFADPPTNHYKPQAQPSDVGFGYVQGVEMEETDRKYLPPPTPMSPLKSAMKSPGTAPRFGEGILSPTFREEQILEKHEASTEKEQAADLKVKVRVRIAKIFLRGINFACSLIVLSMLASVFSIFNSTKSLPPRNNLPPWAQGTKTWPQIVVLVIACISLFMSIVVLVAYSRGGHKRAEKVAAYYTVFTVTFFIFSIVMWAIGAGILNQSKSQGQGKDMWGWSCKDNKRKQLFQGDVSYDLICRLQNWSLVCCIIEVVVETLCIIIYGIVFYRFWSKRKLRKSMAVRDRARSDLYLAQLRSQSAPNTPGFGPMSPRSGGWRPPPGHSLYVDPHSVAEEGQSDSVQFPRGFAQPKPFALQPPPIKIQGATPKVAQNGFDAPDRSASTSPPPLSPGFERRLDHVPAAPGEQQYASVPIPGAYASPLASPAPVHVQPMGFDFGPNVNGPK